MVDVVTAEGLWRNCMVQLGCLERWRVSEGESVRKGQAVAEVSVEGGRHEILAPAAGRLTFFTPAGQLVQPNMVIGRIASPVVRKAANR